MSVEVRYKCDNCGGDARNGVRFSVSAMRGSGLSELHACSRPCVGTVVAKMVTAMNEFEGLWVASETPSYPACALCGSTGVIETGNNDIPCKCPAGDAAMFNVAGRKSPVSGRDMRQK